MRKGGSLVISLDCELYWGMRDIMTIHEYIENLLGVRQVVPKLLELFREFGIHATWATVGFLFFESREQLLKNLPVTKPEYLDRPLNPYLSIKNIGLNEEEDPFHFGLSLIQKVMSFPNQEIGTHTFSHYYCLERGQNISSFKADLEAAINTGKMYDIKIKSLIFPRNQFNPDYLAVCKEMGITSFRGNETAWMYRPSSRKDESLWKRAFRLIDAYINLSGHHTYPIDYFEKQSIPLNIRSSRYLRPFKPKLKTLERIRLNRILKSMTFAAKNNHVYHLWWHPHDFGSHVDINLKFLRNILEHYQMLQHKYGMTSINMEELTSSICPSFPTNISDS
ncbi:polysaccharide deacetylase family protein [Peribacillus glennii]|uniref:Polysaccharide deacetylase n=1 Tax=Peribacillus glennii TaxID=2303991 RepID=A0A372LEZ6_9BACI|nr:polysaccharide deacetylase family protein [Peribacillus glennii]RFU64885.1 polysaccharide deacetylase [Peribacillus glennii]